MSALPRRASGPAIPVSASSSQHQPFRNAPTPVIQPPCPAPQKRACPYEALSVGMGVVRRICWRRLSHCRRWGCATSCWSRCCCR